MADNVPSDEVAETEAYEPEAVEVPASGRVIADGFNVRVNTEVASHAANAGTNISYVDKESGEVRQLPLNDYVTWREQNGL
jgi:hypothetical protein